MKEIYYPREAEGWAAKAASEAASTSKQESKSKKNPTAGVFKRKGESMLG